MARIAILGPAYPYRGGPPLVVAHCYELLSAHHDVEVFSFTRLYPQFLFPGTRQEDVSKFPAKVHPVRRMIDSINPLSWLRTARAIADYKPDLIVVDWYQPFFGACYRTILRPLKARGIRIVFLCENVVSHEGRAVDTFLTRLALNMSDAYVAFSESVEKTLKTWYPRAEVGRATLPLFFSRDSAPVQWSREDARRQLGLESKRVLLFFGYIRKYKGLRNLIAAFDAVHAAHPDTYLLIVGECYEKAEDYEQLIAGSAARESIRWVNQYVANEDIGLYYSAADLVVLPYISATQSGIVKIAFGYDKPVLATEVGGLAEEIGRWNAGRIVSPNSVEALENGLIAMLSEDSLERYAEGARRAKESNSFADILPLIENFLP